MRIFMSAGETSGDALGAALLQALQKRVPDMTAFGMGGAQMRVAGLEAEVDASALSVVGLVEVVRYLPRLFGLRDRLARLAEARRPDVAVLIDAPDFHIRLAESLKRAGIPVVFYVGPTVWAWRPGRARRYQPYMDRLLVLFPFEVEPWRRAGVDVVWVGHSLVDIWPTAVNASVEPRTLAILPGSRPGEIRRHLSVVLEAARRMVDRGFVEHVVLPVAPGLDEAILASEATMKGLGSVLELVSTPDAKERGHHVARAKWVWTASGTATLEVALIGRPQIIFYRVHPVTYAVGRRLARVEHLGLPNLLADTPFIPELLQDAFTVDKLVEATVARWDDDRIAADMQDGYMKVRTALRGAGAGERAADAVLKFLRIRREKTER